MNNKSFEKMTYGVYVVASGNKARKNAFVATAVLQVTAEPLQIAVVCNKKNYTCQMIQESGAFSVSAIKKDYSPALIGNFGFQSGGTYNKFEQYDCQYGEYTGTPIVTTDCVAWFECRLVDQKDVGTHIIFIGEVLDAETLSASEQPLTYAYYHEVKRGATPANAPHVAAESVAMNKAAAGGDKYKCNVCGYLYDPMLGDPDGGIAPGTPFENIPDDWRCPICGVSKADFERM